MGAAGSGAPGREEHGWEEQGWEEQGWEKQGWEEQGWEAEVKVVRGWGDGAAAAEAKEGGGCCRPDERTRLGSWRRRWGQSPYC